MEFIAIKKQYQHYKEEIDAAIHKVLSSGQFIMGQEVYALEEALAEYVGVKHCLTTSSGTDSLLIGLMALGIGPGDEVITTPFSWISTAEVIALVGAKPVFVDIDPDTYNIDVSRIEAAITPKTKALLPVSLYGQMPPFDVLNRLGEKYGIAVIEDGAQSFGAEQNGKKSGSVSTLGVTSFFPAKTLGCYGDGGAIFTNDSALAARMRAIRTHGGEARHHHPYLGLNGRLDTLQAAILLVKLRHFPEEVGARTRVGATYTTLLQECCETPTILRGNTHVYHQYTIRLPERDRVQAALKEKGIPTAIYYPKCFHEQPVFAHLGYQVGDFPVAEKGAQEVISLPMHPWLTPSEQEQIVEAIHTAFQKLALAGGTR